MRYLVAVAILIVGCGGFAPPSSQEEDKALSIVWEQTLQMEQAARPALVWLSPDSCKSPSPSTCVESTVTDDDDTKPATVTIVWRGSFSDSQFADGLDSLRNHYLLDSYQSTPAVVTAANDALRNAGL